MIKITEVFLNGANGPFMGAAEVDGTRVVFEALDLDAGTFNTWTLSPGDWETVNSQPVTNEDMATLKAVYIDMKRRAPFKVFHRDEADWSEAA